MSDPFSLCPFCQLQGPFTAPRYMGNRPGLTASERSDYSPRFALALAAGAQGFQVRINHGHLHLEPARAEVARPVTDSSDTLLPLIALSNDRVDCVNLVAALAMESRVQLERVFN